MTVTLSTAFRVPFARDARGRLVAPEDATRGAAHACPQCGSVVDLHAGEHKRRHFHHRGGGSCTPESVAHATAKALVAEAVELWRSGGAPPAFVRACASPACDARSRQAMPAKVRRAALEHRLPSGRVVDVALLGAGDIVVAAVEIFHAHAVDDEKAADLGAPWIEVSARDVCESAGRLLVPTRDEFLPWFCTAHMPERRAQAKARLDDIRTRTALLRALPFRLEEFPGFEVARVGNCDNGHPALVWAWEGKEPPWPRLPLVVARERERDWAYSRAQGAMRALLPFRRAWVSACGRCGADVR